MALLVAVGLYLSTLLVAVGFAFCRAQIYALRARSAGVRHGEIASPSAIITLVHGTWAQDADWTLEGSVLCSAICEDVGSVMFRRFRWSGRNTIQARHKAADRLANDLESVRDKYEGVPVFVIAHSHGGNIALSALKRGGSGLVNGLVCLATPVIVSRKRYIDTVTRRCLPLFNLVPFVLGYLAILPFDISSLWCVVSGLGTMLIIRAAFKMWGSKVGEILDQTYYADIPEQKVLFVRAPGDEASIVISTAQGLSWVVRKLLSLPLKLAQAGHTEIEQWKSLLGTRFYLVLIASMAFSLPVSYLISVISSDTVLGDISSVALLIMFFGPVIVFVTLFTGSYVSQILGYILFPIILLPIVLTMAVASLALGPEMTIASVVRDVSVEPCPRGTWRVVMLDDLPHSSDDLQHSIVYQAKQACDLISRWIAFRL
ncbi:triacylglycerol lipase [Sphingosinicella sp. CPCC 101087]|uniref:esterase/lipase family protein n=1 Tax=Sphingosinicella sp. CPCC 101087 TaxID=2497754 RepID=UPI00101CF921|nr:alpha/beta hydrolase [Sphingosinicella sp. CPCC 101087]